MSIELQRPTIIDVARVAGVSHQTVSRYLRHNGGLRAATKERVEAAIVSLGYRPNLIARSMRTGRTGRVALMMPGDGLHNPGRLIAAASAVLQDAGFAVDVLTVAGAEQRERRTIELCDSRLVDGVLSFAASRPGSPSSQNGVAVVASADYDDEGHAIGGLASSDPVEEIVARLAQEGHHRFGLITGDLQYASARARLERFEAVTSTLHVDGGFVHGGDWSADSGREAIGTLRAEHRPTAILAANDVVAAAAIRAATDRGWRVPNDLSITGWDDLALSGLLFPALTTVALDLETIGVRGARKLLETLLDERPQQSASGAVQRVIWRDSTSPYADGGGS